MNISGITFDDHNYLDVKLKIKFVGYPNFLRHMCCIYNDKIKILISNRNCNSILDALENAYIHMCLPMRIQEWFTIWVNYVPKLFSPQFSHELIRLLQKNKKEHVQHISSPSKIFPHRKLIKNWIHNRIGWSIIACKK